MAAINDTVSISISMAGTDAIAPVDGHTAKHTASVSTVPSPTDCQQPQAVEALHLDEGNLNVRTKIRTLAIVLALYVVLFIAALDQTIIA